MDLCVGTPPSFSGCLTSFTVQLSHPFLLQTLLDVPSTAGLRVPPEGSPFIALDMVHCIVHFMSLTPDCENLDRIFNLPCVFSAYNSARHLVGAQEMAGHEKVLQ